MSRRIRIRIASAALVINAFFIGFSVGARRELSVAKGESEQVSQCATGWQRSISELNECNVGLEVCVGFLREQAAKELRRQDWEQRRNAS